MSQSINTVNAVSTVKPPKFICTAEVAKRLGVDHTTISKLAKRAGVVGMNFKNSTGGKHFKFTEEQIQLLDAEHNRPRTRTGTSGCHRDSFYKKTA